MNIAEIRAMKTDELHSELDRIRRHLFDLRSQAVTEKLEDPTQLTKTRREIAQLLTVLTERGETGIEEKQYHLETEARRKVAQ
ncbi:MAG: 50S ribosomal protein L29 [Planctomycetes bacterium]|nr:50S ribosomal protein L29 [Planctomycetota bacterium]MCH8879550.1 50S ribosomal protein L29 [Planctomycetota bacterium]MCH8963984.1 50S ribosomal protein L29 [Planctomycetota bacterium]MCH8968701.1 50S ribosomal protein L29 [Planctomycetota bacterium]MCZ6652930.1 50S ribosomal protein L29 [Planctomycetota bacterium]